MHTLPRTNNSILQLTWVVGVYKIYCSNIECPIIREVYGPPESIKYAETMALMMIKLDILRVILEEQILG